MPRCAIVTLLLVLIKNKIKHGSGVDSSLLSANTQTPLHRAFSDHHQLHGLSVFPTEFLIVYWSPVYINMTCELLVADILTLCTAVAVDRWRCLISASDSFS